MKVLMVVDVQQDFCPGGALGVAGGNEIVPVVNRLMSEGGYDLIVASQDWHPARHKSFASSHPGKKVFETISLQGAPQILWPDHAVQNTPGAEFHPALSVKLFDKVIQKGLDPEVDSYSAFRDNSKDQHTGLLAYLAKEAAKRGEKVSQVEVDVVGLALDYCDRFTALDAREFGLKTRVVLDATRAVNQSEAVIAELLLDFKSKGVEVIHSREILPAVRPLSVAGYEPSALSRREQTLAP